MEPPQYLRVCASPSPSRVLARAESGSVTSTKPFIILNSHHRTSKANCLQKDPPEECIIDGRHAQARDFLRMSRVIPNVFVVMKGKISYGVIVSRACVNRGVVGVSPSVREGKEGEVEERVGHFGAYMDL